MQRPASRIHFCLLSLKILVPAPTQRLRASAVKTHTHTRTHTQLRTSLRLPRSNSKSICHIITPWISAPFKFSIGKYQDGIDAAKATTWFECVTHLNK
jgi:hypothetical protein